MLKNSLHFVLYAGIDYSLLCFGFCKGFSLKSENDCVSIFQAALMRVAYFTPLFSKS